MNKRTLVTAAIILVGGLLLVWSVNAAPAEKVWVCKYIGKPGVDERLQTGQNPISVSSNAVPNYNGVGSYFADGQNRSYVLAIDEGQEEPDVSECPVPVVTPDPTPDPVTPVTPTTPTGVTGKPLPTEQDPDNVFVGPGK